MSDLELSTYPGLDERIVIVRSGDLVDAVFVRTERFNVLVDTLETPDVCLAALDLLGANSWDRPLIVVNSHMDWDHFWGNSAVSEKGVIIAHEIALQRLRDPVAALVLQTKAREDDQFKGFELQAPTLTFSQSMRLDGGDLTLELLHTPGHTPDHLAVWIPELRVCLAVDAVESPIPKVWSDDPKDLRALVASLRRIKALKAEHVVLAHGQTSSPAVVDSNLAYFEAMAERVRQLDPGYQLIDGVVPEGFGLWDFIAASKSLAPSVSAFYEGFHWANLKATLNSRGE